MMRFLASTQIQFGGFIINSDDDAAIVHHLTRLVAAAADVASYLVEICGLLHILLPLLINLTQRVDRWMDAAESLVEGVVQAVGVVRETWQTLTFNRLGYAPG